MSKTIKKHDRFEYHFEDLDCSDCLHYKKKNHKCGCGSDTCLFNDARTETLNYGRIKRKRGWNK